MLIRDTGPTALPTTRSSEARLLLGEPHDWRAHSSHLYGERLRRGELVRLRRGVYLDAGTWLEALPSMRHRAVMGAVAMKDPATVFCRESALHLYGLPQRRVPSEITVRTGHRSRVGRHTPPPLTGSLSVSQFLRRASRTTSHAHGSPARLANVPTRYSEVPLPPGLSRAELREAGGWGGHSAPVLLGPEALSDVRGPTGYRVEPLGLVLIDMVPRMDFSGAVILLDAVRRRGIADADPWLPWLGEGIRRRRWERAWAFADGAAESVGESFSRAVLHEIGAPPPELQRRIPTSAGAFRVDFCWPELGVVGEFDGREKYLDPEMSGGSDPRLVHLREKDREDELRSMGWVVVRWGWQDLLDPAGLIVRLRRAGVPV